MKSFGNYSVIGLLSIFGLLILTKLPKQSYGNTVVNLRWEIKSNAPHRSIFRENIIENNGKYDLLIESEAISVVIENNTITDTGKGIQETGIYISKTCVPAEFKDNKFSGNKNGYVVDDSVK